MKNSPYLDQVRDLDVLQKLLSDYEASKTNPACSTKNLFAPVPLCLTEAVAAPLFAQDVNNLGFRLSAKARIDQTLKRAQRDFADARV